MNPSDARTRLVDGNSRYVNHTRSYPNQDVARRESLTSGQSPFAVIVACADSRVVPEAMFDTGLGELFVIRVAGNVASSEVTASVGYAVEHLGTKLVVMLGHESCGAVGAAIAGGDLGSHLNRLCSQIAPAHQDAGSDDVNTVVAANARRQANRMQDESSLIQKGVQAGAVVVPAVYSLATGAVSFLD